MGCYCSNTIINEYDNNYNIIDNDNNNKTTTEEGFTQLYYLILFVFTTWFVGKVFLKVGLPTLIGEIIVGIVLGPKLLNFVPFSDKLIIFGEIGLLLAVLEAGIDVDIGMLKLIGFRGLTIALFGSTLPFSMGVGLSYLWGNTLTTSVAVGACFASSSMGVAMNLLKSFKILNTQTGQLIITAAVLDDVVVLILLSELNAMKDPTVLGIILPIIISPALVILFGYIGIIWMPKLIKYIMKYIPSNRHEESILLFLFVSFLLLVPMCHYVGSSHLLGAFLAGLMFCTDHKIHIAWEKQIKRLMQWSLRMFFSCTIGFQVPITSFNSINVLFGGLFFYIADIGKFISGIFAKPLTLENFLIVGFSMSTWGEFAFILATSAYSSGLLDETTFSSALLAVLLSILIPPYCLKLTNTYYKKKKDRLMNEARKKINNNSDNCPVYFCINVGCKGGWGHQDKLLKCIFELSLELIDFRVTHDSQHNYTHHIPYVQNVFYVLDTTIVLPPTNKIDNNDKIALKHRCQEIKIAIIDNINNKKAKINIMRWLPGTKKLKDTNDKDTNNTNKSKSVQQITYDKEAIYKQAHKRENKRQQSYSNLFNNSSTNNNNGKAIRQQSFRGYNKLSLRGDVATNDDDLISIDLHESLKSLHIIHDKLNMVKLNSTTETDEYESDYKQRVNEARVETTRLLRRLSSTKLQFPPLTPKSTNKEGEFTFNNNNNIGHVLINKNDEDSEELSTDDEYKNKTSNNNNNNSNNNNNTNSNNNNNTNSNNNNNSNYKSISMSNKRDNNTENNKNDSDNEIGYIYGSGDENDSDIIDSNTNNNENSAILTINPVIINETNQILKESSVKIINNNIHEHSKTVEYLQIQPTQIHFDNINNVNNINIDDDDYSERTPINGN